MVKLVRFVSDNNCNFKASFGNDIIVNPGGKVAVLNATFKPESANFRITQENNVVGFVGNIDPGTGLTLNYNQVIMAPKAYTGGLGATIEDFAKDFLRALNGNLGYHQTQVALGAFNAQNQVFSEWDILFDGNDNQNLVNDEIILRYAYAVLTTPLGPTFSLANPRGTKNQTYFSDPGNNIFTIDIRNSKIQKNAGNARNVAPDSYICAPFDAPLSSGNGLYMARVRDIVDNTTGLQNNGFAIGLGRSDIEVQPATGIDNINPLIREYEIRINRGGENYQFRQGAPLEADSGFAPQRINLAIDADVRTHDIIWFKMGKQEDQTVAHYNELVLQAGIWYLDAGGVGRSHKIFTHRISDDEMLTKLKPYILIFGAEADCKVDGLAYTPSPFGPNPASARADQFPIYGSYIPAGDPNGPLGPEGFGTNDFDLLADYKGLAFYGGAPAAMGSIMPCPDMDRFNVLGVYTTKLNLHGSFWNQMKVLPYNAPDTYFGLDLRIGSRQAPNAPPNDYYIQYNNPDGVGTLGSVRDDENYLVVADSFGVDSYDASKNLFLPTSGQVLNPNLSQLIKSGRRKNIIMTIPVEDVNNDSIIQYEASTPIFIDLLNSTRLNLRNLEFRILNRNFSEIKTNDEATLTILIDSN